MTTISKIQSEITFPLIKKKLNRRGLTPYTAPGSIWEIHQPTNYLKVPVIVGLAEWTCGIQCGRGTYVAIYPNGVYAIDSPSDWGNINRPIPVRY